jgi:hypothetical protein
MAKPCERSSRLVCVTTPPDLGVWLMAGVPSATTSTAATTDNGAMARMRGMKCPPR